MTNVFHFTFVVKEKLPPQIVPKTYPEVSDFSAQLLYTVFCISVDDVFDREKTFQAQHRSLVAVKRRCSRFSGRKCEHRLFQLDHLPSYDFLNPHSPFVVHNIVYLVFRRSLEYECASQAI